jgi:hypothetical protein
MVGLDTRSSVFTAHSCAQNECRITLMCTYPRVLPVTALDGVIFVVQIRAYPIQAEHAKLGVFLMTNLERHACCPLAPSLSISTRRGGRLQETQTAMR